MRQIDIGKVIIKVKLKKGIHPEYTGFTRTLIGGVDKHPMVGKGGSGFVSVIICLNSKKAANEKVHEMLSEKVFDVEGNYFSLDEIDLRTLKVFYYPCYVEVD